MRTLLKVVAGAVVLAALCTVAGLVYVRVTGLTARARPGELEASVARAVRGLAVPRGAREQRNPVPATEEALASAMAHYADHCAVCHGADGRGDTDFGRGLYPPPPDMRAAATQQLTDGELFYIIENGVRFTGMPAFATGDAEGERETWEMVHFLRRLPKLTAAELERLQELTPRSAEEIRQELEEERFLRGEP